MRPAWSPLALVALLGGFPVLAAAAPPAESGEAEADPGPESVVPLDSRSAALLADGANWTAGTVGEQLDRDTTLVPYGKGALFVPALTNPLDEPPVTVSRGDERVAEGTSGNRIILSPGTYLVQLGSGNVESRLQYQATVREGHTTVIPVSWAGLSVHVVDEAYGSLRSSYEIIRVDDRQYMGLGFGTDEQAGEPVTTWIMPPGLYKIVRLGETYRARRDFATVRLVAGYHTHFLLVLDAETGEFAGGGEVPRDELFQASDGFFGSLVLGGDVNVNTRSGVPGLEDGLYFSFRGFLDARLTVEVFDNPLVLRLQVEEGQTKGPSQPFQKTNDRIDLDALYIYRLKRWIGPYARLGAETNLLPGNLNFDEPTDVLVYGANATAPFDDDPAVDRQLGLDEFRLSPSFGLTTLKEGIGLNVRVFKSLFAESNVRTGFGARHRIANNLLESVEAVDATQNSTPIRRLRRVSSSNQVGIELTILAVFRLTRWVLVNLEFDSLIPFDSLDNTVLEAEASVALKLTSFMSLNYVVRFLRDRAIFQQNRFEQDVLLRFSLELF